MMVPPYRTCKIIQITQETPNTRRFFMEIPELDVFDFKPGQFVTLDLPINESAAKRRRSYSIASWPDGTNRFELVIVLQKDGAGTEYLFNEMKVGGEMLFRGPLGKFTLPEKIEEHLFLICTGTGIAPFRSMVHFIKNMQVPHKNIYLLFGSRKREDLLYYNELKKLETELTGFHYIPVLSREEWEGSANGYVHEQYEKLCSNREPAQFYLCGWKNMVIEARSRIEAMGYGRKSIHQELYG
jgi:NAD(P)H-flavin reductase